MSANPFGMQQVIDRIKSQVSALQLVEGAAEYAAISNIKDFRTPCAYALLVSERGDGKGSEGAQQRANVVFGVVIADRNYRDTRGHETMQQASPIIGLVRSALIGWMPVEQGARKVTWVQGDVLDWDDNTLVWADVFTTQHFIGA